MKKTETEIKNVSRKFEVEELLFSTTDGKGIITSCNEVFLRVGAYPADELIGKPHNTVRHPHMPRCVFKLLWDYLLDGKAIGAYVKNLAKTGEYYWVFALAAPIEGGFLSIRLKPTSDVFNRIPDLYAKLLQIEEEQGSKWKVGMQASTEALVATLAELGFNSYDEFMSLALKEEMRARDCAMGNDAKVFNVSDASSKIRAVFSTIAYLDSLKDNLIDKEQFLCTAVENLSLTSINSSVRAARSGDEGRTLAVISSEISRISGSIRGEIVSFREHLGRLRQALSEATLGASLARLQDEMSTTFESEARSSKLSIEEQIARYGKPLDELIEVLNSRAETSASGTFAAIASLNSSIYHFSIVVELLTKIVRTLRFAYVTGKTEASRLSDGSGFIILLDELNTFTDQTQGKLDELSLATETTQIALEAVL